MTRARPVLGLLFLSILLILSGCLVQQPTDTPVEPVSPAPAPTPSDENPPKEAPESSNIPSNEELFAVIQANTEAFNNNDIAAYMETIHSQSPYYHTTMTDVGALFQQYKFKIEVFDLKVVEKNEQQAIVSFTQRTTKIEGPEYQNNESTGTHTLKLDKDEWKIDSTTVDSTVYLDQKGQSIEEGTESGGNTNYQYRDIVEKLQFYLDDRQWQEVYYNEGQGEAIAEFILATETIDNWTELFTIHYFENSNKLVGVDNFLTNFEQIMNESVTGDFFFKVIESNGNDAIYEFVITNDAVEPDQNEVARVFAYGDDLFVLRYTVIDSVMEDEYFMEWVSRLKQAVLLKEVL